eukprot:TRINITY_DN94891_c0_g1_i1.p2 TRINITY_DN94891_c0_g1~~TRINITY_DN94891_c0_g1_i1.p2  ORF type:complete len:215 (-),score=45.44 TRINITY_DN94891_c0_g1_i1:105-749(-)
MPGLDYWDIDDILAEQLPVTARTTHEIVGGAVLAGDGRQLTSKDLPENSKIQIPFWLARGFLRRNWSMTIDVPMIFSESTLAELSTDATVCRVNGKWMYYFEMGMRISSLMKQDVLDADRWRKFQIMLMTGLRERWREVVTDLSQMNAPRTPFSTRNPDIALFPHTLTRVEKVMYDGGREAEKHWKEWVQRFGVQQMKPSALCEAPTKKARTSK